MKKNNTSTQSTLFVCAFVLALASCNSETKEAPVTPSPGIQKLSVDAIVVQEKEYKQEEQIVGTLAPYQEVDIVSEVPKKVKSIHFKDGERISQGQLLYKLDDADLKAQLKRLEAGLRLSEMNEQRLAELLKSEAVMQQQYDEAESKLHALQAEKEIMQVQLAKTEIHAPFSGTAGISKVHIGSFVSPNIVLVNLQDQTKVKIYFSVPEDYLDLIHVGNKVTFTTEVNPEKYTAIITASEPGANAQTRSILVQATTENARNLFKSGISANIFFPTTPQNVKAITVPTVALIPGTEGYTVFKVKNGLAKQTPVQLGSRSENEAVITSGIASGDTLMVSNILRASEGTPVHIASLTSNQ